MKRIGRTLLFCVALIASAPLELLLPGCANPTTQKVAVATLGSVHQAADASYQSYIALVLKGKVSENGVTEVSNAYREFQREFAIAVKLVRGNTNAVVPVSVFEAQSRLNMTINTFKTKGAK